MTPLLSRAWDRVKTKESFRATESVLELYNAIRESVNQADQLDSVTRFGFKDTPTNDVPLISIYASAEDRPYNSEHEVHRIEIRAVDDHVELKAYTETFPPKNDPNYYKVKSVDVDRDDVLDDISEGEAAIAEFISDHLSALGMKSLQAYKETGQIKAIQPKRTGGGGGCMIIA